MTGHAQAVKSWLGQVLDGSARRVWGVARLSSQPQGHLAGETCPEKFTRLVDLVPGQRILELGAAEGVLSLLLAQKKEKVFALELKEERHEEARTSQGVLAGARSRCRTLRDGARQHQGAASSREVRSTRCSRSAPSTILAAISTDAFDAVGRHVPNVVLCGNRNRARKYAESHGNPDDPLGKETTLPRSKA